MDKILLQFDVATRLVATYLARHQSDVPTQTFLCQRGNKQTNGAIFSSGATIKEASLMLDTGAEFFILAE